MTLCNLASDTWGIKVQNQQYGTKRHALRTVHMPLMNHHTWIKYIIHNKHMHNKLIINWCTWQMHILHILLLCLIWELGIFSARFHRCEQWRLNSGHTHTIGKHKESQRSLLNKDVYLTHLYMFWGLYSKNQNHPRTKSGRFCLRKTEKCLKCPEGKNNIPDCPPIFPSCFCATPSSQILIRIIAARLWKPSGNCLGNLFRVGFGLFSEFLLALKFIEVLSRVGFRLL